jgi:hypothetical protein
MTASNAFTLSVLHVATARSWRGGEQQVAYLTSELAKKNIRQYVLCTAESPMAEFCRQNGIPFFTAFKRSSVDISYAKKIKEICKSNNISLCMFMIRMRTPLPLSLPYSAINHQL